MAAKRPKNHNKPWTEEEERYLADMYGTYTELQIARKLGRTRTAVRKRREDMGLGPLRENAEWIHITAVIGAIYGPGNGGGFQMRRLLRLGFPAHEKRFRPNGKLHYIVYLDELWDWLYEHRRDVNFKDFERNILGEEPAWVAEKRSLDKDEEMNGKRGGHNASWETWEDEKLRRLLRKGVTLTEAAGELRKKERALLVRRKHLGIEEGFIKNKQRRWTKDEVDEMLRLYDMGASWRQIGLRLGRGAWACEAKYDKLQNPGYYGRRKADKERPKYRGGAHSAAETREIMLLHSIGALDGFEEVAEIGT